jgi:hypothetical protein
MLDKLLSAGWYVMTNGTLLFALPLSRHLRPTGQHDSFGKLKVTIIDHKWDDKSRQERESFWIRKLETIALSKYF